MAKGYMIERAIMAKGNDALNRRAVATVDIDGGALVKLGDYADGAFKATKATDGDGLWMAYNPSYHITKVGEKEFAGLSVDPRDYTNIAGRTIDVFKPQAGVDIVAFTDGNIKVGEPVAVGKFLEQGADGLEVKTSATEATTSFKVIAIENLVFPTAGIGQENAKLYVCEVAHN